MKNQEGNTKPAVTEPVVPEDTMVILGKSFAKSACDTLTWKLFQSLYYVSDREMTSIDARKYHAGIIAYVNSIVEAENQRRTDTNKKNVDVKGYEPLPMIDASAFDFSKVKYALNLRGVTCKGNLADAYETAKTINEIDSLANAAAAIRARLTSTGNDKKDDGKKTAPVVSANLIAVPLITK